MGQYLDEIPEYLAEWILKQHVFWVASAPLTGDGLVNLSPKSLEGTFHVVNSKQVWYEDLTGSGVETISHIRENGRITILFNAFDGPPRIARLYGRGLVHEFGTDEYNHLIPPETRKPGSRAAIVINVFKVTTTCGFAVPFYTFKSPRTQLNKWAAMREAADREADATASSDATGTLVSVSPITPPGIASHINDSDAVVAFPEKGLKAYWRNHNAQSLDGLPGLLTALNSREGFRAVDMDRPASLEESSVKKLEAEVTTSVGVGIAAKPSESTAVTPKPPNLLDSKVLVGFLLGMLFTIISMRFAAGRGLRWEVEV